MKKISILASIMFMVAFPLHAQTIPSNSHQKVEELIKDGMKYFKSKDYDIAEKIFEKAIKVSPQNYQAYEQLGYIYGRKKQFLTAQQSFEKALELNPENAKITLALVEMHRMLGEVQEAKELLSQVKSVFREKGHDKGLAIVKSIEKDLKTTQYKQLKAKTPGLIHLESVLADLDYEPDITEELAIKLLPFYEKTPSMKPGYPNEMKKELETMLFFLQNDLITEKYYEEGISEKHIDIYALLLGSKKHGNFFREFCKRFKSLNKENKECMRNALQCSYQSYIGWILLRSKGFKVVAVSTFVENSNFFQEAIEGKKKTWSFSNLFSKTQKNKAPFYRSAHASLIVDLSQDQYTYLDLNNLYVSEPFSSKDYECNTSEFHCRILTDERPDVFSRVSMLDKSQLKAVMYGYVADFYRIQEQDREALECLNDATIFAGTFGYLYGEFAKYYFLKGQYVKTFEYFDKAILADPSNDTFKYFYGLSHLHAKNYDEAIRYFQLAILYYEKDPAYFYTLAEAFFNKKQYPQTIESLQKAIDLGESNPTIHYNLGLSHFSHGMHFIDNGEPWRAKKKLKKALNIFTKYEYQENIDETKEILKKYFLY